MPGLFNLAASLSPKSTGEESDIISVKHYLSDTGDLTVPEPNSIGFADRSLFDGIKNFQKKNKLATDGVMKKGGPTEARLDHLLRRGRFKKIGPLMDGLEKGCKGIQTSVFGPLFPNTAKSCKVKKSECEALWDIDRHTCSILAGGNKVLYRKCEESAMERFAACLVGKPLPPLFTG